MEPQAADGRADNALEAVRVVLARLRGVDAAGPMIDQATHAIATVLGFDRVAFLRAEDGSLVRHDTSLRTPCERVELSGTLLEVVRRRQARLVRERGLDDVLPASLADVEGFVVAPVVGSSSPIGVLYADRSQSRRGLDVLDRDVLWTVAEAFAFALERALLMERVGAQRQHFHRMAITGEAVMRELAEAPLSVCGPAEDGAFWDPAPRGLRIAGEQGRLSLLSPREREVMDLLAEGARNREIAARLVVSEETVKWHVSRIVRKLHASNRVDAVSRYLRFGSPTHHAVSAGD